MKVDGDKVTGALPSNPWTLCTVTQVEEVPNSLQTSLQISVSFLDLFLNRGLD